MLVIDRASRMVLSMQLIDAGDSLSAKMAQAIADAARTTGTRPKKIVVLDSINCDQFKPIFKSADISLEQTSSLPIFFALVNELSDSMRNGELGKN
jgi:hypothetical protein